MKSSVRQTFLYLIISILIPAGPARAASPEPGNRPSTQDSLKQEIRQPVYTTSRLVTPKPVIDGKLDDECWKHGTWAGDYRQYIPHEGAKPTWPTEMNIQYDDRNLYIAFRAWDGEPDKIVRMSGGRDEIVGDVVGIAFDSYRDYRTGFEFTITAWGQKVDLVLFNPMDWDFNWNAVWKGKTGLEDSAWVAEIEIPFSQLRYSNKDEQVWGMHTWRWIARLQEESNWEIQSKTGPGLLYNFGELKGIKGLPRSRRLEIMPFVLGELETMKAEAGNPFNKNGRIWKGNAGLDAKIGISSNFTIDLTVNPDFGQVESDPSVMNLTAFETFYEEKRPFFLEGLTIFNYDFDDKNIFYSRRIGQAPSLVISPDGDSFVSIPDKTRILSAAKFSGTTAEGLSLGLIQSVTATEYARIGDRHGNITKSRIEPLTSYTVARVQKGYNAGNTTVGAMLTSTNRDVRGDAPGFPARNAFTGGFDLRHHWKDKKYFLETKLLGSHISGNTSAVRELQRSPARYYQRPGADYVIYDTARTSLSGFGGKIRAGKGSKGFWKYSTGISWLSPGLELNDIGYMNKSDEIRHQTDLEYIVNKPVSIFHTWSLNLEQFNSWNFGGTYLGSGANLKALAEFTNNYRISTNLLFHSKAADPWKLRGGPDMIMPGRLMVSGKAGTDPSKRYMFELRYNYEMSGNKSSRGFVIGPGITLRPLDFLKIGMTVDYDKNHDELQYIATKTIDERAGDRRYILGTIDQKTVALTFRADLNLTPEFSVQYYGSPFVSRGAYSALKRVRNAGAGKYADRFGLYDDPVLSGGNYILSDYDSGERKEYSLADPDFNFYQFRSNLVAKWEYRPGSWIYLVWSADKTGRDNLSGTSLPESYRILKNVYPENIFLIKINYWFSL
ncbi:MAG TPA: DUF5916 domain-containing protein [Bacteroidales bacterium]|jgi:hypothetical protein|nr:DUF5916 domain-containing protein [Bacteroidales bacterium]HOS71917.1 DUF5916 domain-containing protein [Bacteroidales bacterium]HQH24600.1 DUF5916 domain-containing protein [Bacteroidales bacterium]HQJ82528.1 DUF5916 domain-containing protein [Bacteroidales bacterium]